MRVPSDQKNPKEHGGWFHANPKGSSPPPPVERKRVDLRDVSDLADRFYRDPDAAAQRSALAVQWRVDYRVLEQLMIGCARDEWNGRRWLSFPSRDADGRIVGIVRRYADGAKKTYPGTSNGGIFMIPNWWHAPGPVFVVEGASDVAALVNIGLCALGRPSNVGGVQSLRTLLQRRAAGRPVVVLGENDRKLDRIGDLLHGCRLDCPGCSWCWPGRFGAESIAGKLGCGFIMPPRGVKDAREWSLASNYLAADLIVLARSGGPCRGQTG